MPDPNPIPEVVRNATTEVLQRLLELFPVSSLRNHWPLLEGTKNEIAATIAAARDYGEILEFIDGYFCCCRQHIYLLSYNGRATTAADFDIPNATLLQSTRAGTRLDMLFLWQVEFEVVTRNPVALENLTFLVPIKITVDPETITFRFVILEKDLGSYSDTGYRSVERKTLKEAQAVDAVVRSLRAHALAILDIDKGIKTIWDEGKVGSSRTKYKGPVSTSTEDMDGEREIKHDLPDIYEKIKAAPIINQLVHIVDFGDDFSVSKFTCSPTDGYLSFNSYSERVGDTDEVIAAIIESN